MAATQTVPQDPRHCNFVPMLPRLGVITLFGYGINVHVDRGHLIIRDGIGPVRREARLSRVGHGLRRLVVIGSDGMVSLAAMRWLADQDASFVMLDRDGSVLVTTGPVRSSDVRMRRAQSLANQSGAGLEIARKLIDQKLAGQERLVRTCFHDLTLADSIGQFRASVEMAKTIESVRLLESQGARAYWSAWNSLPIMFPKNDLRRVPEHWKTFGTRRSPISGSPRLAINPPNAILNYLYAVLESEARLAVAALGLDPGIGVMHTDTPSRDSLACDLMEPVRPHVDAFVLDWIAREPLRREWFFEQRDGSCRLMGSFTARLSETAQTWRRAVAPIAEWISRTLWSTNPKPTLQTHPATHLTQTHRRIAKGGISCVPAERQQRIPRVCRTCGVILKRGLTNCAHCSRVVSREGLIEAARPGRVATHRPEAEARRGETQRRQAAALKMWKLSDQPAWLNNKDAYREKIQPGLSGVTVSVISSTLSISKPYAASMRAGGRIPHPRHWLTLARLVGVSPDA